MEKCVLITGCSSGFGFETALLFARKHYTVFASMRDIQSEGAKELETISKKENLDLHILHIDVTRNATIQKGIATLLKRTNHIDVLVNNAGFGYVGAIEDFDIDEITVQYDTNIYGVLRMIKAVAPIMRRQESGMIINISSINGRISFPLYGIYSSSKFALETISESLRFELNPFGIKVALVEPGSFATKFNVNRRHPNSNGSTKSPYNSLTEPFLQKLAGFRKFERSIMSRFVDPRRVANCIYHVSHRNNPKLHNLVGIDAHVLLFLSRIIPDRLKFYMFQKVYRWS